MTDTTAANGALSTMKVAELQAVAAQMGIKGTAKMRKAELVDAIRSRGTSGGGAPRAERRDETTEPAAHVPASPDDQSAPAPSPQTGEGAGRRRSRRAVAPAGPAAEQPSVETAHVPPVPEAQGADADRRDEPRSDEQRHENRRDDRDDRRDEREDGDYREGGRRNRRDRNRGDRRDERQQGDRRDERQNGEGQQGDRRQGNGERRDDRQQGDGQGSRWEDEDGTGRRRRNRNRRGDRKRGRDRQGGQGMEDQPEQTISDEDVLVPVAGILDVQDQYAFLRTSGYLPGQNDVYVPINMVKRNGMRKGDAVTGAVKARDEDQENPQVQNRRNAAKFNALVRVDTVNGMSPEEARKRVDFNSLTPLYPQERLRLETDSKNYTTRIIDLVAPIGKGQRGLIVSPAKAGKTMIMQNIANAITANNPEVHLMVVLVDERPEEVTDFERSVRGEVISSTFDRPASDHTIVAELAIERAKRLVELGRDVVVLLDGITRLGRAYNLAAPASGRILSGGVDSAALYPPKKFFGAARNIENGGSLTILATALVESGSKMDEVIFEEFKGTGNMELRLSRSLAERRTFPAIDVNASGTRREEILLGGEELKIMWKLRRLLSALDPQQSLELLLSQMKKTNHNYDFLVQVQQNASIKMEDED